ncbi:MAG: hypothetical protein LBG96_06510 [Tannerella sp.]|nr:hypothetical protein [Tannerella sp.]
MNTVNLSSMNVKVMDHNELVICNGGNKAAYDMGHAVGDELRKAFDTAIMIVGAWFKFL